MTPAHRKPHRISSHNPQNAQLQLDSQSTRRFSQRHHRHGT